GRGGRVGRSIGCGAPRSEGSSGRQRQRKGRGEGGRPGAAPHGAKVQAGSEAGKGTGWSVGCGRAGGGGRGGVKGRDRRACVARAPWPAARKPRPPPDLGEYAG